MACNVLHVYTDWSSFGLCLRRICKLFLPSHSLIYFADYVWATSTTGFQSALFEHAKSKKINIEAVVSLSTASWKFVLFGHDCLWNLLAIFICCLLKLFDKLTSSFPFV